MAEKPASRLEARAVKQHGAFTRGQARAEGVTDRMLARGLREGRWTKILPSVYVVCAAPRTFRQRAMAATLWSGGRASHLTAAALWELDGIGRGPLHVTVVRNAGLRNPGVAVHRTGAVAPGDRATLYRIPTTSALCTVLDLAGIVDPDALELVVEDALRRRLFTPAQFRRTVTDHCRPGVAGSRALRALAGRRIGGTDSGWEVRVAQILVAAGLPEPVRQLAVTTADGTRRVDLAYPGTPVVVFEYDSDRWHSSVAHRHRDADRRNELRISGCLVVEVTPALIRRRAALIRLARAALGAQMDRRGA